jgi:predicted ATPase/DNA-binding SARP family transcriptional activator/Tfp pilus assembly protein PilF
MVRWYDRIRSIMSTSLPTPITRFVGRARELSELCGRLSSDRLLTLTGPGGSGKTRLALQLASDVSLSVYWIDLSAVVDPDQVADSVRRELGLGEQPDRSSRDLTIDFLHDRSALLVFDNCEQVSMAVAALTQALLDRCGGVQIVATSLQPLGLPRERVYAVPPLGVDPHPNPLPSREREHSDAVQLFLDRAREVLPTIETTLDHLALIDAICRRLDGLPLAIELAAARVKVLSLTQIADRLEDALQLLSRGTPAQSSRHQTLRAVMQWSDQLLTPEQQTLFRRLAVFAGSFTLEAIEAVCSVNDALDTLSDLVDRSLVVVECRSNDRARYRLLLIIRQYAREQLEASGKGDQLRSNLLQWAVTWAENIAPHLVEDDQAAWLQRIEIEQDNWRAALRWACTSHQVEAGLRLANALWRYWMTRNYLHEGRAWLEELIALSAVQPVDDRARAYALFGSGRIACRQSDDDHAAKRGEESLTLFRALNDEGGVVKALSLLALVAVDRGEYARAEQLYAEALTISRRTHDDYYTAVLLVNLGLMHHDRAEFLQAARCYEEALTLAPLLSEPARAARDNLGDAALRQGQYTRAEQLLADAIALDRDMGNHLAVANDLINLAEAVRQQRQIVRARQCIAAAIDLHRQAGRISGLSEAYSVLGDLARDDGDLAAAQIAYEQSLAYAQQSNFQRSWCTAIVGLGRVAAARGDLIRAGEHFHAALQRARSYALTLHMLTALEQWAIVLIDQGEVDRTVRWLSAAAAQRAQLGTPLPPTDQPQLNEVLRLQRAAFDAPPTVSFDQVVAEALTAQTSEVSETSEVLPAVLGEIEAAAPAQPIEPLAPPEPALRIFALGPARVLVHNRALTSADWTYTKAKELLFYFIAHPPATKAQIGLDVWPEASADQLRNIFHRALHHLRKALGQPDWIVFADDTYSFNRSLNYWCDLHEFETLLGSIGSIANLKPADRSAAIQRLESAVQLWRGDFVEDLDAGEWAIFQREELRQRYVQALIDLGALHFADAHYDRAAAAYRRLLSLDAYLELAHRELMRCLVRQGEVGHALQHYQRLREMLRQELQAEPSPETVMMYERIKRGDEV